MCNTTLPPEPSNTTAQLCMHDYMLFSVHQQTHPTVEMSDLLLTPEWA